LFAAVWTAFHCLCQASRSIKPAAVAEVKIERTMTVDSRPNRPENSYFDPLFRTGFASTFRCQDGTNSGVIWPRSRRPSAPCR
jgi:hypothetical protein